MNEYIITVQFDFGSVVKITRQAKNITELAYKVKEEDKAIILIIEKVVNIKPF
ncbi:hypothetical protein [Clostridium tagluense]|uniref:Uncharacterized protein n=1 Tax=Clostridium tagluense TaxID=360422 RepID=A0A401USZ0_9CLOT|nr:hypothetical protein [Clostridium tagluense]GCD12621.1 hypothetical protein Ctaglu_42440 [Clostridium tagluense]